MQLNRGADLTLVGQLRALADDESGATTTEYVILVSLIAVALIAVMTTFGEKIAELFTKSTEELDQNVLGQSYGG